MADSFFDADSLKQQHFNHQLESNHHGNDHNTNYDTLLCVIMNTLQPATTIGILSKICLLQFILSTICRPSLAFVATPSANTTIDKLTNAKWILKRRPQGVFDPKLDMELVTEQVQTCGDDEIVVQVDTLSVDAFIRTMLDEGAFRGSIPLGNTIPAMGFGTIVHAGKNTKKKIGTQVQCMLGAQTYATVKAAHAPTKKKTLPKTSPTASLGLMGLTTGITAYAGVFYVLQRPKKGDTVVVTAAAGAVGSIAAQLAKTTGARGTADNGRVVNGLQPSRH